MGTTVKQANFLLPEDLIVELKKHVSKRQQSKLVAEAIKKELNRIKMKKTLDECFGAWNTSDHPELKKGTNA
ncbi:MAG: hypothetical protein N2738_05720, partial [Thermodesulfovibrionales bacterium]|nr:hypothetical protein [Thermodesulfovibrionales bacterium]